MSAEPIKDPLDHNLGQLEGHTGLSLPRKAIRKRSREGIRIPDWYVVVVENRQVL